MCFSGLKMNDIVNHFVLEAGCIKRNHTAIQYIIYVSIIITINGIILSVTTVQYYKKIITFFFFFPKALHTLFIVRDMAAESLTTVLLTFVCSTGLF